MTISMLLDNQMAGAISGGLRGNGNEHLAPEACSYLQLYMAINARSQGSGRGRECEG